MLLKSLKRHLNYLRFVIILAAAAALLAIVMTMFFRAFYSAIPLGYEPKDIERGTYLERKSETRHGSR